MRSPQYREKGHEKETPAEFNQRGIAWFAQATDTEKAADMTEIESVLSSAAAALGRRGGLKGGKSTSAAKRASSAANGKKGGRPKKKTE